VHGSVTVAARSRRPTSNNVLAIDVPAFVAFYRASADYSGADDFELEISLPNVHKWGERAHVMVTKSSSAGEVSDVAAVIRVQSNFPLAIAAHTNIWRACDLCRGCFDAASRFSNSLSGQREKQQRGFASATPNKAGKAAALSLAG
jgi:hypothetical protein